MSLSSAKLNHSSFAFLVDKVKHRLHSWESKYLSLPGRVTLIKTTLSSLPLHIMYMFKLPEFTLNCLDKLSRKLHPISWDKVCSNLNQGGLNFPKANIRNPSLLMSLAWRFIFTNKDSLWATILHHKYNMNNQLNKTKTNNNTSLTRRSLKHG